MAHDSDLRTTKQLCPRGQRRRTTIAFRHLAVAMAMAMVSSSLESSAVPSAPGAEPPTSRWQGRWVTGRPDQHALNPGRLAETVEAMGRFEGVYGVLIVHRGELIVERYFREGFREKPHNLKSASKSILSALLGIAIGEGHLGLDQPIADFLPDVRKLKDNRKQAITIRHLLTMTSGLKATSYKQYNTWILSHNWVESTLASPLVAEPGALFQYSTADTHLLSAVLSAATGRSTRDYAEEKLFGPMAIRIRGWQRDPSGIYVGGNNLSLTPRDLAKFGQLYLDGGRWRDRQLIPREWIEDSTRAQGHGFHDVYGSYGYLWYADPVYANAYFAVGFGGQYLHVSPAHDTVIVVTSTLEAKGKEWVEKLIGLLREGLLEAIGPSPQYYARLGRPVSDPALDSFARAIDRAQRKVALLVADPPAGDLQLATTGRTLSRTSLRSGPDGRQPVLAEFDAGTEFEILWESDGWLYVRENEREGWLKADRVAFGGGSWRTVADNLRRRLETFSRSADVYLAAGGVSDRGEVRDDLEERERIPDTYSAPNRQALLRLAEVEALLLRRQNASTDLENRLGDARKALASAKSESKTIRSVLDAERAKTREERSASKLSIAELERSRAELSRQLTSVTGELDQAIQGQSSLVADLDTSHLRVVETESELRAQKTVTAEVEIRLAEAQEREAASEARRRAETAVLEQESAAGAQSRLGLENQLAEVTQRELGALQTLAEVESSKLAGVEDLEDIRAKNSDLLAEARKRLSDFESAKTVHEEELAAVRRERSDLEVEVAKHNATLRKLSIRLALVTEERSDLEMALEALAGEVSRQLTSVKGERDRAEAKWTQLAEEHAALERARVDLEERLEQAETAHANLDAELTQARDEADSTRRAHQVTAANRSELARALLEAGLRNLQQQAALADAEAARAALAAELEAIRSEALEM